MKKIFVFSLAVILCICNVTFLQAASPIALHIDGENIQFDESTGYPFIDSENRTMMPLRACLSYIGCTVSWDQDARVAIIKRGATLVNVPVGKPQIYVNGNVVPIDTAAVLKNGRTYLPLRAVFEAYKYKVDWDAGTKTINAASGLTPKGINGGTTGIFSRQQFQFIGFDGIQADIRLPEVTLGQKGDCPYVYFGFDLPDDKGNAEGGFQFIEDEKNPGYNKWTVYLRQGSQWSWGDKIILIEQGETHNLKFRAEKVSGTQTDLVIELDGKEVIRQKSSVSDFGKASVKSVAAMAMSVPFDGTNCPSSFTGCMIGSLALSEKDKDNYTDATQYEPYSVYKNGIWYGTVDCIPDYLHYSEGDISIYRVSKTGASISLANDEVLSGEVCDPMIGGTPRHELTQKEMNSFIAHFNSCDIREGEREKNSVNFHNHMSDSIDVLLNMKNGEIMYITVYYDGDISVTNEHGNDYYLHNFALQDYIINTMGQYLYPDAH